VSQNFKVVVTDQVFQSIDTETQLLAAIGARIEVADGTTDGVACLGGDADALLNTYLPITDQLLGQLPACKIVARYGIGTDNVDVAAAARRGVVVTNVPDYSVEEVAVHALGLMLALTARGGLVDVDAVIEAMQAGRIRAAALDVLDIEPPAAGRLPGDLQGLLVTPHMAYYSEESIAESQRKAATQVVKVLTGGQPDYPVRP
jgi:phosphoglycerate dehydrogenase-like enzyme